MDAKFKDDEKSKYEEDFEKLLSNLPEPIRLEDFLTSTRRYFVEFPTAMLGEVGLDRASRIPLSYSAERRHLTRFSVPLEHQVAVLEAQIDLAVEYKRNISMHSVKAQNATVEFLRRMKAKHGMSWLRISVDLHSCGLSPESWRDIEVSITASHHLGPSFF